MSSMVLINDDLKKVITTTKIEIQMLRLNCQAMFVNDEDKRMQLTVTFSQAIQIHFPSCKYYSSSFSYWFYCLVAIKTCPWVTGKIQDNITITLSAMHCHFKSAVQLIYVYSYNFYRCECFTSLSFWVALNQSH